jgi:hypothetical protein
MIELKRYYGNGHAHGNDHSTGIGHAHGIEVFRTSIYKEFFVKYLLVRPYDLDVLR